MLIHRDWTLMIGVRNPSPWTEQGSARTDMTNQDCRHHELLGRAPTGVFHELLGPDRFLFDSVFLRASYIQFG